MRAPVKPATDQSFSFSRLPAGSYYLALVSDFDAASWVDRSFRNALIPGAIAVELKEGEHKTQDIQTR